MTNRFLASDITTNDQATETTLRQLYETVQDGIVVSTLAPQEVEIVDVNIPAQTTDINVNLNNQTADIDVNLNAQTANINVDVQNFPDPQYVANDTETIFHQPQRNMILQDTLGENITATGIWSLVGDQNSFTNATGYFIDPTSTTETQTIDVPVETGAEYITFECLLNFPNSANSKLATIRFTGAVNIQFGWLNGTSNIMMTRMNGNTINYDETQASWNWDNADGLSILPNIDWTTWNAYKVIIHISGHVRWFLKNPNNGDWIMLHEVNILNSDSSSFQFHQNMIHARFLGGLYLGYFAVYTHSHDYIGNPTYSGITTHDTKRVVLSNDYASTVKNDFFLISGTAPNVNTGIAANGTQRVVLTSDYLSTITNVPRLQNYKFYKRAMYFAGTPDQYNLAQNITVTPSDAIVDLAAGGSDKYILEVHLTIVINGDYHAVGWGSLEGSALGLPGIGVYYKQTSGDSNQYLINNTNTNSQWQWTGIIQNADIVHHFQDYLPVQQSGGSWSVVKAHTRYDPPIYIGSDGSYVWNFPVNDYTSNDVTEIRAEIYYRS